MPTNEQIREIFNFVRGAGTRHWLKGLAVFALLAVAALIGALQMPRSYYSEARLFVRFGRENQVDPTAAGGQMVSLYESRESEINSLIEILKSRTTFDRVVADLGPQFVLGNALTPLGLVNAEAATDALSDSAPPPPLHQRAVARLDKAVFIGAPRKSNIISVACKAASPEAAQRIVAKLVEVYLEEHLRVHRSPGTYEFFEDQTEQTRLTWQQAQDELRDKKNALGIVTMEGQRKKLEDQIADTDTKLITNQADLKTSLAKIASLEHLISELPETLVTQETAMPHAAFDGMRQTLYQLEVQEQDLAARMQESHPRLIALRQQVRELREIVASQPTERVLETAALNPKRQALELALLTETSQADSLRARERSLAASRKQLDGHLQSLNTQVATMDQLQQRVALAETNHKDYVQKLEQARISRSLDEERISSLSLVQPASYSGTASGPRRSLVLMVGLCFAGLSSVATVLGAAWMNPVIASAEQLRLLLDLPLAGVIPTQSARISAAA